MEQMPYSINKRFLTGPVRKNFSNGAGFTKKDLVVVLCCFVFLLISIAAVGESGRRRAKEAVCLSNLRQWGNVFQMFANDNDGKFMQGWVPSGHADYWMDALRPYYGDNPDLRCCPEAVIPGTAIGQSPYGGVIPNATFYAWGVFPGEECGEPSHWPDVSSCDYGSYGINGYIYNLNLPSEASYHWGHANVKGGGNIPMLGDNQWIDTWPHHTNMPPDYKGQPWVVEPSNYMARICIDRHNGCVQWVFLDYSARKVPLKCLWKLKWHRTFDLNAGPTEEEFNTYGTGWMGSLPPCE